METSTVIKQIRLLFLILPFIAFCKDSTGTKSPAKHNKANTVAEKDTISPKKATASLAKNPVTKWNVNASAAQVKFSVRGPFGTVHGTLSGLKATILFDKDDLAASSIHASTDVKSISTGIKLRDRDVQKEKYLNSDTYPSISFRSDKIQNSGKDYKAIGDLTIKGVTKRIEMPFSFSEKGNAGVFKGSFAIQREDFGIGKSGGSIGSTITIDLEVPATK